MYRADYHMHTNMSPDSEASIESQIETAIERGLQEIAITDHFEYDEIDGVWQLTMALAPYQQKIAQMQAKYHSDIIIRQGVEIGYEKRYDQELKELMRQQSFDFVICSTHKCEHQELAFGGYYKDKTQKEAYSGYFNHVLETLENYDDFDVYGHIDYMNRYGDYKSKVFEVGDYSEQIDAILGQLIKKDKGLEVNTSGIRYGLGAFNPQATILKRYYEKGGRIATIGSDSHKNEHVGFLRDEAAAFLKNIGFEAYATFEKRKVIFQKL